jgi:hypothetical protein
MPTAAACELGHRVVKIGFAPTLNSLVEPLIGGFAGLRVLPSEGRGREFESRRVCHIFQFVRLISRFARLYSLQPVCKICALCVSEECHGLACKSAGASKILVQDCYHNLQRVAGDRGDLRRGAAGLR